MENPICQEISRMEKIYKAILQPKITDMQGVVTGSGDIWNSLNFWINQNHLPNLPHIFRLQI